MRISLVEYLILHYFLGCTVEFHSGMGGLKFSKYFRQWQKQQKLVKLQNRLARELKKSFGPLERIRKLYEHEEYLDEELHKSLNHRL